MDNRDLIEAMIAEELGNTTPVQEPIKAIVEPKSAGHSKVPYKPNKGFQDTTRMLVVTCSNKDCSRHMALNPKKVNFNGISLKCFSCNSPMVMNK